MMMNNSESGFFRVAAASPKVKVADVKSNIAEIKKMIITAEERACALIVFPELCITGYTCGDLFRENALLDAAIEGLIDLRDFSRGRRIGIIVGLPYAVGSILLNCAALIYDGEICGLMPKTYIPNYNEFYEKRRFASGIDLLRNFQYLPIGDREVIIGSPRNFNIYGTNIAIEICEDMWVPTPMSNFAAMGGADIIVNLSATDELIGKHDYLVNLLKSRSAALRCGYVYASAGAGESSTDLVFSGNAIIAENGRILAKSERFTREAKMAIADIDVQMLRNDRINHSSFHDCARINARESYHSSDVVHNYTNELRGLGSIIPDPAPHWADVDFELLRPVDPHPFVPTNPETLNERCQEIISIQSAGLQQRLEATGCKALTVGISGGLDSTLALLVAVHAFDKLGLDRRGITGITMPGFGTTDRTHDNAVALMNLLGVTAEEISIVPSVKQHFEDIGQNPDVHDVTYENVQARMRTLILMNHANKTGGMVLGTGDMSELALGWCTYNGDHMSMYGVNSSVPKTLVKHLVKWFAIQEPEGSDLRTSLLDIVNTPISPELIPANEKGEITQKTEDLVGPYELHDFFLYNMLRHSFPPKKIYILACHAFKDKYERETIMHWLRTFYRRFFNQQFKRSCMPDGPKVGSVSLSPRGDWRMPSDACSRIWLEQLDSVY